jgi:hypothetical protein
MSERRNVRSETEPVVAIATEGKERGSKLLIPKGRFVKVPPPRVFCKKSAEVIENKGSDCEKERKERSRVTKLLNIEA